MSKNKFFRKLLLSTPILGYLVAPVIVLAAPASYGDWLCAAWDYASIIILPISTIMLMAAGFLWTVSGGDPGRIGKAKEIIWGVVSGLGFLLLSYFLIVKVIGVDVGIFTEAGRSCMWNI